MSKIISFDIGIRNMAYCIFDISTPPLTISEWTVLNVGQIETTATQHKCTCTKHIPKSKKENALQYTCDKPAKFADPTHTKYYCNVHAKTSGFILPKKIHEQSALKKHKAADLYAFIQPFMTPDTPPFTKKQEALDFAKTYFDTHSLKPIDQPVNQNVKEINLLTIGRNIKILFDQSIQMSGATHVIIENQISPLANRMKTIQGMVAQYFIMKNSDIIIEFISSANKLKGLVPKNSPEAGSAGQIQTQQITCRIHAPTPTPPEVQQVISASPVDQALSQISEKTTDQRLKDKYKQHKSDAILICRQFLTMNSGLMPWIDAMNSRKKDDLADCFLQGIWYLKSKNIISYAENLKINSI